VVTSGLQTAQASQLDRIAQSEHRSSNHRMEDVAANQEQEFTTRL
jgi:hypothetical protein